MKYTISILLIFVVILMYSQTSVIDSLKKEIYKTPEDTSKINLLNKLAYNYKQINLDSAKYYSRKALIESKKINYLFGEAKSKFYLASINHYSTEYDTALIYAIQAKRIFQILDLKKDVIKTDITIGTIYERLNKVDKSLKYFKIGLDYAKQSRDSSMMVNLLLNIGAVYSNNNNYDQALKYYLKALEISKLSHNFKYKAALYYNIGFIYENLKNPDKALEYYQNALENNNIVLRNYLTSIILSRIGNIYKNKKEYQKALNYEFRSLKIAKELGANENIAEIYMILGKCYVKLNKNDVANKYFNSALELVKNTGDARYLAVIYNNYSTFYYENHKPLKAIFYLSKAIEINKTKGYSDHLAGNYLEMAKSFQILKDYKKSNEYYNIYLKLRDSLQEQDNAKKIYEIESRYRIKEKVDSLTLQKIQLELKSTKLSHQKILNIAISFIAFLLLTTLVLAYVNLKRRKRINQKLKSLDKTKSRFFANISHELRTPLTLILAPLENLIDKIKDKSLQHELQLMKTNSNKILTLIDEILDISKLESNKLEIYETSINLYNLCKRIFNSYQSLANFKNIITVFQYNIDKNLTIDIDIEKFEKILNNLLTNAFKYSFFKSEVSMSINYKNGDILIDISDTGKGIKKDDITKIFHRFYQVQDQNEPMHGGTGLGLSIAKEYSKSLNGDILVKSVYGKGSIFTFVFTPKISKRTISYKEGLSTDAVQFSTKDIPYGNPISKPYNTNILIVEDDLEMNKYLQQIISAKYNFLAASDGLEATKILEKEKIDLIISDVMMPNMDGFEFKKLTKNHQLWRAIPFIMLTARALDEDKLQGFMLGVDDYITKPFNVKELLARVNNLLLNKQRREKWALENSGNFQSDMLSVEDKFIKKAEKIVLTNIDNSKFLVSDLATKLNYSKRQLERLLKKHTGYSPNAFIREIRLLKAYKLIKGRKYSTVLEICYAVGMENPSYFIRKFSDRFGIKPGEIMK